MGDSKISSPEYIELLKRCIGTEPNPMDPGLRVLMVIADNNPDLMEYATELKVDVMTPITSAERSVLSAIGISR